ncbi:endoribonuclease L-PSP [Fusarium redolens]|uniref:Endoribonuclease L-PSP n=1 Tax=Fusarium redolens TaxID=48865 RepID=A0A9P9KFC7_FUSRE|nr:endoribonuclease L-PSP [Fusarium redolens]KAH7260637.1 endoribonuclease L-PSP [Fusarium redolens]
MSFQLFNYPGQGVAFSDFGYYSQAVKVGNIVKLSGQGGWNETGEIPCVIEQELETTYNNILRALQSVNSELSFDDVYLVRSFHTDLRFSFEPLVQVSKRRFPNHRPTWTAVEVSKLALDTMHIEVEIEAVLPEKNEPRTGNN